MEIFFYFTHSFEVVKYQGVKKFLHKGLESVLILKFLKVQASTKQP